MAVYGVMPVAAVVPVFPAHTAAVEGQLLYAGRTGAGVVRAAAARPSFGVRWFFTPHGFPRSRRRSSCEPAASLPYDKIINVGSVLRLRWRLVPKRDLT